MSDCILWEGAVGSSGYGRPPGKGLAHRKVWQKAYGPIPEGMEVLHSCDTKLCINLEHLHLGTQGDNVQEAWDRGLRKGKYSDYFVRVLWTEYHVTGTTLKELSAKYGITNLSRLFLQRRLRD